MTLQQGSRKTWAVHGEKSKSRPAQVYPIITSSSGSWPRRARSGGRSATAFS
jgi:hypothetical protein